MRRNTKTRFVRLAGMLGIFMVCLLLLSRPVSADIYSARAAISAVDAQKKGLQIYAFSTDPEGQAEKDYWDFWVYFEVIDENGQVQVNENWKPRLEFSAQGESYLMDVERFRDGYLAKGILLVNPPNGKWLVTAELLNNRISEVKKSGYLSDNLYQWPAFQLGQADTPEQGVVTVNWEASDLFRRVFDYGAGIAEADAGLTLIAETEGNILYRYEKEGAAEATLEMSCYAPDGGTKDQTFTIGGINSTESTADQQPKPIVGPPGPEEEKKPLPMGLILGLAVFACLLIGLVGWMMARKKPVPQPEPPKPAPVPVVEGKKTKLQVDKKEHCPICGSVMENHICPICGYESGE